MRIPKSKTIRSNIHRYAHKAGMSIIKNSDGSYNIWSIPIGYTTHRAVNMDTVVRVVIDELYAKKFRMEASLS